MILNMVIFSKIKYIILVIVLSLSNMNIWAQSAESDKYFARGVQLYEKKNYYEAALAFLECYKLDLKELPENNVRRDYGKMWLIACTRHDVPKSICEEYLTDKEWSDEYFEYPPIDRRKTIESDIFAQKAVEYYSKGNLKAAIRNYLRCAEIEKEQLGDLCWWYAQTLLALGDLYAQNSQYEEARDKYVSAVDIFAKNNKESIAICGYLYALLKTNNFCSKYNVYPDLQNSTHRQYIDAIGQATITYLLLLDVQKFEKYDSLSIKMSAESYGTTSVEYSNAMNYRSQCCWLLSLMIKDNRIEYLSQHIECLKASLIILAQLEDNAYNEIFIERLCGLYKGYRSLDPVANKEAMERVKLYADGLLSRLPAEERFSLYVKYYSGFFEEEDIKGKEKFYSDMIQFANDNDLTDMLSCAELYDKMATLCINEDWEKYEKYQQQRLEILKQHISDDEYIDELFNVYKVMALLAEPKGQLESSLLAYRKLADIYMVYKNDIVGYAGMLKKMGHMYSLMGKASDAVDVLNQALDIYRRIGGHVDDIEDIEMIKDELHVDISELLISREKVLEAEGYYSDTYNDLTERIYERYKLDGLIEEAIVELDRLIDYYSKLPVPVSNEATPKWQLEKAYCLYELTPNQKHDNLIDSLFVDYEKLLREKNDFANSERYNAFVSYALHKYKIDDYKSAITWVTEAINVYPYVTGSTLSLYYLLYTSYRYDGRKEEAEVNFKKFCELVVAEIMNNILYMNLDERWKYWEKQVENLKLISRYAWKNPTDVTCGAAYNSLLLTKGFMLMTEVALKNYIEDLGDKEFLRLYERVVEMKKQRDELIRKENMDEIRSCEKELHKLELSLMHSPALKGYSDVFMTDWKDIQASLRDNDVAIEFVEREFYKGERSLLAFLLKKNYSAPRVIPIDGFLEYYDSLSASISERGLLYKNEVLYDKIWGALESELVGVDNVYFSPDGVLNTLAIENLSRNGDRSLFSKKLYRLSSTREILNQEKRKIGKAALYGGLDFNMYDTTTAKEDKDKKYQRAAAVHGLLSDLAGTEEEITQICEVLKDNSLNPDIYLERNGTEESFNNLSGNDYSIIHVASHGKYLPSEEMSVENDHGENQAMIRSCLYLAGANKTLLKGDVLPHDTNDGILTAKEISLMDLKTVDIVVLSACETGLGDITSEGVFGLQRGFKKAGVNSVLMSLWKVDDLATSRLMTEFYTNWIGRKMSKYDSLEAAKKVIRETKGWEDPEYWAAFILLDGVE